ncbi:hypothetical protein [Streptomyces sp. NPDC096339]|uniref:hypothetical protein n=1 Tax=Streptomyces sp. NPDC096339 TaxID=3366086 RepID=UPI00381E0AB8
MSTPKPPSQTPVGRAERLVMYAVGLALERDSAEAAARVAESEEVMATVGRARVGRIGHKTDQVWMQAVSLFGFLGAAWFLITVAVMVGGLFLPRSPLTGYLVAAAAALPSALCVSREAAHEIAKSALRRGRLTAGARRRLTRVRSDAFVLPVTVPMYGVWLLVIQPWAVTAQVTR